MSHFAAMKCRFTQFEILLETLKTMGVPPDQILIHQDTHGVHVGYGTLPEPRPAASSAWTGGSLRDKCSVIVTEQGMKAMGRAATDGVRQTDVGINTRQNAELGFRDCGCSENPGLVLDTDPYESGGKFTGWFTATYQLGVVKAQGFEASVITTAEDGSLKLLVRQKPKGRGLRGVAGRMLASVRR